MDNQETEVLIYEDTDYEDNPIRVYDGGGSWQSATFLAPEKKYELVFEYMRKFNLAFDLNAQIRKVLVIGGAGFAYPKYLIAHYPDVIVDVVDCDPTAYETACRFFFLDDLITEYDQGERKRLSSIVSDGRHFLEQSEDRYDLIINDAYVDMEPAFELLTCKACKTVMDHLNEDGVYVLNLSGNRKPQKSPYLMDVIRTLKVNFRYVMLVQAFNFPLTRVGNYVLLCSNSSGCCQGMMEYDASSGKVIQEEDLEELTQDFHQQMLF